jgi:stage V sporulation protein G
MEITEVRIKLVDVAEEGNERLQAFCSINFEDAFVVRDLRVILRPGGYFVAMPSRNLTDRCNQCGNRNDLQSKFCNECGSRLARDRAIRDANGHFRLHADVAHPINH